MSAGADQPPFPRRGCDFPGCTNAHRARGLCSSHLDQLARGKPLTPLLGAHGRKHEKCTLDYCDRPHQANGLCTGHKTQRQRGRPLQPLGSKGWFADPKGYIWVKAPDHPNAKKNGYVQEHVKVMSEVLGRPLRSGETVHHKNLIRGDNRPENLELWTSHQPKGARVQDMVEWCRWFLAKYGKAFPE